MLIRSPRIARFQSPPRATLQKAARQPREKSTQPRARIRLRMHSTCIPPTYHVIVNMLSVAQFCQDGSNRTKRRFDDLLFTILILGHEGQIQRCCNCRHEKGHGNKWAGERTRWHRRPSGWREQRGARGLTVRRLLCHADGRHAVCAHAAGAWHQGHGKGCETTVSDKLGTYCEDVVANTIHPDDIHAECNTQCGE
jgi:hypothetical protein